MQRPITNALVKIFAKGFYREHSGLLLFLFVVIFSHLFWMKPLGGHLTHEESIYHHLIMLISFADDPVMMIFYFIIWLIYSMKSWSYIEKQLKAQSNQFLFYSITSLPKYSQFQCWFIVQFVILLPAVALGLSAMAVGIAFHSYFIPVLILLYLLLLSAIAAMIYVWRLNQSLNPGVNSLWLRIITGWKKPFFSLYIYHIFNQIKLGYLITKLLSWITITGIFLYFSDLKNEFRLAGIAVLLVTISHTFLIYQSKRFEDVYMPLSKNLAYPRWLLFLNFAIVYLFLIIPELIWILYKFNLLQSLVLIILSVSIALLFQSLTYLNGHTINRYVKSVFSVLILCFLLIMFGYLLMIPFISLPVSWMIFYKGYYSSESSY